jgi:hypothetical protein
VKLRRDVAAVPLRTGAETWAAIVGLITKSDSVDAGQLSAAATVMASLLAEEHYTDHPLTLKGDGHRLVIYCAYGADALSQGVEVTPIDWNPTAKDWTLYVPCDRADLDWVGESLKKRAPRLVVHDLNETPSDPSEKASNASATAIPFEIDWGAAR